jgi:hypothetical protein
MRLFKHYLLIFHMMKYASVSYLLLHGDHHHFFKSKLEKKRKRCIKIELSTSFFKYKEKNKFHSKHGVITKALTRNPYDMDDTN